MKILNERTTNSKWHLRLDEMRHLSALVAGSVLIAACTERPDDEMIDAGPSDVELESEFVGQSEQPLVEDSDTETPVDDLPPVSPEALALEIEILSFAQASSFDQRTRELADGTFQFRPADDAVPTGTLTINFEVDGVEQAIESNLIAIVQVGGEFPYYLFETENGRRYQAVRNTVLPYVRDIRKYEELNLDQAKQLYLDGTPEEREEAIWDVWKLDTGEQVAEVVEGLTAGQREELEGSARVVAGFEIHHPTVTQAVQSQLQVLLHYEGPVDGYLSADTISAVSQFQQDNDLRVTGYLSEETLIALFASTSE